jgi:hypothetical protein
VIWNQKTNRIEQNLTKAHEKRITQFKLSKESNTLVSLSEDNLIACWSINEYLTFDFKLEWKKKFSNEILSFDIDVKFQKIFVILNMTNSNLIGLDLKNGSLEQSRTVSWIAERTLIIRTTPQFYFIGYMTGSIFAYSKEYRLKHHFIQPFYTRCIEFTEINFLTGHADGIVYLWPKDIYKVMQNDTKNITFHSVNDSYIINLRVFNREKNLLALTSSGKVLSYSFKNDSYYVVHDFNHTIDMKIKDSLVDLISPSSILISSKLPFFVLHPSENVSFNSNSTDFYLIHYTDRNFNGIKCLNCTLNEYRNKPNATATATFASNVSYFSDKRIKNNKNKNDSLALDNDFFTLLNKHDIIFNYVLSIVAFTFLLTCFFSSSSSSSSKKRRSLKRQEIISMKTESSLFEDYEENLKR